MDEFLIANQKKDINSPLNSSQVLIILVLIMVYFVIMILLMKD